MIFQNSDFYLKAQILSLATNYVSCFSWSERLLLFILGKKKKKNLPSIQVWIAIVHLLVILPGKNDVPWNKELVQLI